MGQYRHLTLEEREGIMVMRAGGMGVGETARATGRARSTISRELARKSGGEGAGREYRVRAVPSQ